MTSRSRCLLISLACVALAGLSYSLRATAFAESDRWTRCRSGDPDARIAACTHIIVGAKWETKRDLVTAYVNRGDAYFVRSEFDRAVADYSRALRLDKKFAPAYSGRGRAYRGKGDPDKALADFDAAVRLDSKSSQLRIDRGAIHEAKGNFDRAIADYDKAIERAPFSAPAHNARGRAFLAKHAFDDPVANFSKAIELNPHFAEAFLNRAKAYRGKQDFTRAKRDLEAALTFDSKSVAAKEALAEVNRLITEGSTSEPAGAKPARREPLVTLATADRLIVVAVGFALIALIIWFFWLKRTKGVLAAEASGSYKEAMILVKGGYTPDTIIVRSGKPVRLNFRREETASCSDKVIFADFGKSADLPTGQTVTIEILPNEPGEFDFACPMGMFRGKLVGLPLDAYLYARSP
ncbi:MAG: hypothetical protein CTY36_00890 [Methylocystis sp.]|jgi:tetratricopeptide (TPR) repeat protein|nr:MAG: hypothetical protein CTY36_00890 [Methylocystis sp.]PWB90115.1 hypothetical protein C5688_12505 [Methylocystis sp. MitZ-2018]